MDGPDPQAIRSLMRQPKRLAVLAYLVLHSGYVRRDQLFGAFWPRSDQQRARASLRQTLSFLRRSLGPGVIIRRGNEEVAVDPGRIWCDVTQFEADLSRGAIEIAIGHYRGDLMEGFFVQGASGFHDWLDFEQARLRHRSCDAAWALADRLEHAGRAPEAAFWGKRALSLTTFDEPGVRRLIRLLDRVGDRDGALRAYRGLESHLAHEYGVKPSPETVQLIEEVMSRSEPHPGDLAASAGDRRKLVTRRIRSTRRISVDGHRHDEERRVAERRSSASRRRGGDRRLGR